ncbi:MAG: HAD hydrolase-like protein [Candidatus Dormibacteraeota bacterium]|uniref:HAD hydrolase-like protein n=1 Tax=Candidatus Amunia macphersoniae TaxID=3127014 RepID=A0A934NIY4_9BACT|nr:HAD hydrolase-like protein [Candidatus Dormibacteraeota bacterium]
MDEAHSRHFKHFLPETPALSGAADLLAELHRRDVTMAVATSSTPDDLRVALSTLETASLIDHVITSDDVGNSKPAPDLAVVALRVSGSDPAPPSSSATPVGTSRRRVAPASRVSASAREDGPWPSSAPPERWTCTTTVRPCSGRSTTATSAAVCARSPPDRSRPLRGTDLLAARHLTRFATTRTRWRVPWSAPR